MPLIDMPLEKLNTYQGLNPKPDDFELFWDNSLAEMRSLDSELELIPAEFKAPGVKCFDLYFTGVGGARIYAKLLTPENAPSPHPAILTFHGYSGNSGPWMDKLSYVSMGYTVASLDCRGQGGKSEDVGGTTGTTFRGHIIRGLDDEPEKLLFRRIFLDTAQLAKIVMEMPEVDETRVGATGGSQGGGLTLACAALETRIKAAASTFPFLSDYKRVWEMDLAERAYEELRNYFRLFDPLHEREDEIFNKLGYIDVHNLAPRIKAKIQMNTGLMDMVCPPSTQFAAYNNISSEKSMVIYPDFGHEGLPGVEDSIFTYFKNNL